MVIVSNSTGAFYDRSVTQMGKLRSALEGLQTQIATGVRIERGSDDPIAAARLRAITRLEQRGATEAQNAARLGQELTEGANAIGGVVEILQRARELAVAASSDTLGADGRAAIAAELPSSCPLAARRIIIHTAYSESVCCAPPHSHSERTV